MDDTQNAAVCFGNLDDSHPAQAIMAASRTIQSALDSPGAVTQDGPKRPFPPDRLFPVDGNEHRLRDFFGRALIGHVTSGGEGTRGDEQEGRQEKKRCRWGRTPATLFGWLNKNATLEMFSGRRPCASKSTPYNRPGGHRSA